jgi:hypothetical protein
MYPLSSPALLLSIALLPLLTPLPALAESWHGELQGGGAITVDPETHRAVIDHGAGQRPLWDGVHRLDDGSTVITHDGIAIPTEQMYQAWSEATRPQPIFETRYCHQLVRKTCGFDNACNNAAACMRARSMLADEGREQRDQPLAAGSYPQTATSDLCRKALDDPAYTACESLEAQIGDSRCRVLVDKVCGAGGECGQAQPCNAAHQLLRMETEERLANDDPGAITDTGRQCVEAMGNAFFAACDAATAKAPGKPTR